VCIGLSRPSVDEETDWNQERKGDDQRHAEFWFAFPLGIFGLEFLIDNVASLAAQRRTNEEPKTEREIIQTGDAQTLVVPVWVGPQTRKGRQR
jgi:hypothetical protein